MKVRRSEVVEERKRGKMRIKGLEAKEKQKVEITKPWGRQNKRNERKRKL